MQKFYTKKVIGVFLGVFLGISCCSSMASPIYRTKAQRDLEQCQAIMPNDIPKSLVREACKSKILFEMQSPKKVKKVELPKVSR